MQQHQDQDTARDRPRVRRGHRCFRPNVLDTSPGGLNGAAADGFPKVVRFLPTLSNRLLRPCDPCTVGFGILSRYEPQQSVERHFALDKRTERANNCD